jgi:hypothetical protein
MTNQIGGVALVATLLIGTALSQTKTTATNQKVADSYSIYSLLIPDESSEVSSMKRYIIEQQTLTKGWQKPTKVCIDIPPAEAQEYDSAISDFEQKNISSVSLEPRFTLEKPYLLLNESDVVGYRKKLWAGWGFGPKDVEPNHSFDGGSALISLSRVGFSNQGNVALVYVQHFCASTCGGGSLHLFKKYGGKWIEENRVRCAWDS